MYNEVDEWVRVRNLRISIAKGLIEKKWDVERIFLKSELKNVFLFKAHDLAFLAKDFFNESDGKYTLLNKEKIYLKKILHSNKIAEPLLKDADERFVSELGAIINDNCNDYFNLVYERYKESLSEIIQVLHWGHIPIFNKYLLHNRGINPEEDTLNFYNHFDCLKSMLDEIEGKGQVMQIKSDATLGKELKFEVYNRRWRHSDCYRIKRTIDGWECRHLAINGKCEKSGEGALFNNLKHDNVFFPEDAIMYAMENLWEAAEEGEINLFELKERLQQVADWISHVEKSVAEKQPDWVNYY